MVRWGKSSKSPAPAVSGASAGTGEVAVQKVDKIEVHNLLTRPPIYGGGPRPRRDGGGAAEGEDIDRKAEEFITQRKKSFHGQKSVGPAAPRTAPLPPPPPRPSSSWW